MKEIFILLFAHTYCQELCSAINQDFEEVYPAPERAGMNNSVPLYFGLMLSLSGAHQSSGALAGAQAALDEINSRDDLLPGYSLHYTLTDSKVNVALYRLIVLAGIATLLLQCNRTAVLDRLFTQLLHPSQQKVALVGSGCSLATEVTAEISHYYNVTQVD